MIDCTAFHRFRLANVGCIGFVVGSVIAKAALKNDVRFKSGRKRLESNHLAWFVLIRDILSVSKLLLFS